MKPFKLQYPSANYIIQKTEIEPDIQMIDFDDEKKMLSVSPQKGGVYTLKIFFENTKEKNIIIWEINLTIPELIKNKNKIIERLKNMIIEKQEMKMEERIYSLGQPN